MSDKKTVTADPANTETAMQPAGASAVLEIQNAQPNSIDRIAAAPVFNPGHAIEVDEKKLEAAKKSAINVAMEYHEFVPGEPVRGIFLGLTTYNCTDKESGEEYVLTGAVWVEKGGKTKINCAVKLVTTLAKFEMETPFEATHTRTKKTGNGGNMQLFDIRILDYTGN